MKNKKCTNCHNLLDLIFFNRDKTKRTGYASWCKRCTRARDRNRDHSAKRRKYMKEYTHSERGRKILRNRSKKYYLINSHKITAKRIVEEAVKSGKLIKCPCIMCGDKNSVGHHPDYSKPLNVVWLCNKHHLETHRILRDGFILNVPIR